MPFAFAVTLALSRLSFAFSFAFAFSFGANFSAFSEQQRATSFTTFTFAFLRVQLVAPVCRMRVSYVSFLAKWSSAGRKRFALLKSQRIPIRFACIVRILTIRNVIILQVILIVISFRTLI
jgi:hypothetical protein